MVAHARGEPVLVDRPFVAQDPDPQHQFVGVVIIKDARQLVLKLGVDPLGNVGHRQLLVDHHLAVELDAQQPGRHPAHVQLLVGHLEVGRDELPVLVDDGGRRVRVVVHLCRGGDAAQRGVLERALDRLGRLAVPGRVSGQINRQTGRLDRLRDVDDLRQARDAQGNVLGGDSGKVEGVERHLRRRLADRLGRHRAHDLARVRHGREEARLDLSDQPLERVRGQAVFPQNALGGQRRPQQAASQQRRVALRLGRQRVVSVDHLQPGLAEVSHALDDVQGVERRRGRSRGAFTAVPGRGPRGRSPSATGTAAEGLLGVPDQALEVDGEDDGRVAAAENLLLVHWFSGVGVGWAGVVLDGEEGREKR